MTRTLFKTVLIAAAVAASALYGCSDAGPGVPSIPGSGSQASASSLGALALSVQFPQGVSRQQGVPLGAAVVKVRVVDPTSGNDLAQPQIVGAPTTGTSATVTFQNIRAGAVRVIATAHPDQNAAQPPLASGQVDTTVTAGSTTQVTVPIASTINTVTVSPTTLSLTVGGASPSGVLTASVTDASNTALTGAPLTWSSSNSTVATVTQSATNPAQATVAAVAPGTATIEVREFNTGKTADATVTVTAP